MWKMQKNLKKLISLNIYIVIFTTGVCAGFVVHILSSMTLKFSKTVDLQIDMFGIFTLMTTVGMAIYIANVINKKNSEHRIEKDIIIEDIKIFRKHFSKFIINSIKEKNYSYTTVVANLKKTRINFKEISDCINELNYSNKGEQIKNIKLNLKKLLNILTNTNKENKNDLIIKNSKATISNKRKIEIEILLNATNKKLFKLIIEINRY